MAKAPDNRTSAERGPLRRALDQCKDLITAALVFGIAVNLLYLAPSLFMLQVYDRVLLTGGLVTLFFIGLALVFALGTLGFLDAMRGRIMMRINLRMDRIIAPLLLNRALERGKRLEEPERLQLVREFDALRAAISGPPAAAIMDAPWSPIFVIVCMIIHPILGLAVAIGGAVLVGIAIITERAQRRTIAQASEVTPRAYAAQEADASSAPTIRALGMRGAMIHRQMANRQSVNEVQAQATLTQVGYSSATKFLRLTLQSTVLGVGAWLAVERQISPGAMIAASILSSRALSPLEQIVGAWRQIGQSRNAYKAIDEALNEPTAPETRTALPAPQGALRLERVSVRHLNSDRVTLNDLTFATDPGEILGIIGPSGAGKSTLARVAAGAVAPAVGAVRLDGANLSDWDSDALGKHIGYLPQDLHLLAGTIAENIRRFSDRNDLNASTIDAATVAAAQTAGAHEMILRLPKGYETQLGFNGAGLSLGQAQRVALARALYGSPSLLVLDEPNAHLDSDGEAALLDAMRAAKARGATIILVAHRAGALSLADRLLTLVDGRIQMIGPRDEVIKRQQSNATAAATPIRAAQS